MSKWVIDNIELIRKTYVVEAYGEPAAKLAAKSQAPTKVETLAEVSFNVTAINEYEYNKEWMDPDFGPDQLKDQQNDWVGEIERVEVSEGKGTLLDPDRLKGPSLNEIL